MCIVVSMSSSLFIKQILYYICYLTSLSTAYRLVVSFVIVLSVIVKVVAVIIAFQNRSIGRLCSCSSSFRGALILPAVLVTVVVQGILPSRYLSTLSRSIKQIRSWADPWRSTGYSFSSSRNGHLPGIFILLFWPIWTAHSYCGSHGKSRSVDLNIGIDRSVLNVVGISLQPSYEEWLVERVKQRGNFGRSETLHPA